MGFVSVDVTGVPGVVSSGDDVVWLMFSVASLPGPGGGFGSIADSEPRVYRSPCDDV